MGHNNKLYEDLDNHNEIGHEKYEEAKQQHLGIQDLNFSCQTKKKELKIRHIWTAPHSSVRKLPEIGKK